MQETQLAATLIVEILIHGNVTCKKFGMFHVFEVDKYFDKYNCVFQWRGTIAESRHFVTTIGRIPSRRGATPLRDRPATVTDDANMYTVNKHSRLQILPTLLCKEHRRN